MSAGLRRAWNRDPGASAVVIALLALAALAIGLRATTGAHAIDDAYITFRYARNLASGQGLVYNPGEAVLGTTAPLFAIVLAAFMKLGADPQPVALALSVLADASLVFLVYALARELGAGRLAAVVASAAMSVAPLSMLFAVSGMETSVFAALSLAALVLAVRRHALSAGLVAGLAALTRPEGYLVAVLVPVVVLAQGRRRALTAAGLIALVVAPWLIAATLVYGSPVPQSALAKGSTVYDISGLADDRVGALPVIGVLDDAVGGRVWTQFAARDGAPKARLLWIVLALAALAAAVRLLRQKPGALALLAFPTVLALGYAVANLRGNLIFGWYLVPVIPFALAVAMTQTDLAARAAGRPWSALAVTGVGVVLLANQVVGMTLATQPDLPPYAPAGISTEREALYREAALDFPARLDASTTVALPEIGAFGYFSEARVLDTVGLVSPEALHFYPLPSDQLAPHNPYAIPARLITELQPDYLATLETFARNSLLRDGEFLAMYELIATIPTSAFDSHGFLIFRRRD